MRKLDESLLVGDDGAGLRGRDDCAGVTGDDGRLLSSALSAFAAACGRNEGADGLRNGLPMVGRLGKLGRLSLGRLGKLGMRRRSVGRGGNRAAATADGRSGRTSCRSLATAGLLRLWLLLFLLLLIFLVFLPLVLTAGRLVRLAAVDGCGAEDLCRLWMCGRGLAYPSPNLWLIVCTLGLFE